MGAAFAVARGTLLPRVRLRGRDKVSSAKDGKWLEGWGWEWGQKTVGSAVRGMLLVMPSWAVTLS